MNETWFESLLMGGQVKFPLMNSTTLQGDLRLSMIPDSEPYVRNIKLNRKESIRRSRIYTPQSLWLADSIELTGPSCHYLTRVLRLSVGDSITVFNGDGRDYRGKIHTRERQRIVIRLFGHQTPANESPLNITLVQGISRGERMDYTLQKATELGVCCIQPMISQRVEFHLDEARQAKRLAHWRGVVVSACEQSGRAVLPGVNSPLSLDDWLACPDESLRLVFDPTAENRISTFSPLQRAVSIVVGPEGGFGHEELGLMLENGVQRLSLGPRILRTETAAPAAIAILQAIAGDL